MGLFSILNTGFIKGDELVFVSGDKRETGERNATLTAPEKRQKKTRTKVENEKKGGQASHIFVYQST